MTDTKSIFLSKTIWGVVLAAIPSVLGLFGIDLGDDAAGQISNVVNMALELGGAVLAIYGRMTATQKIA